MERKKHLSWRGVLREAATDILSTVRSSRDCGALDESRSYRLDRNTAERVCATLEDLLNQPIQRVGNGDATLLVALSEAEAEALLRACRDAESIIESDRTNAAQHGWSRAAIRALTGAISQIYDAKRRNARC